MTLSVVAQEATTFRGVLLLLVGLAMIGAGTFAVLKPEKAVQLSYAWRRWWARSLSLGKLDASEPVYSDVMAKRLMLAVGIVLGVVGIGLLIGSIVSLSD